MQDTTPTADQLLRWVARGGSLAAGGLGAAFLLAWAAGWGDRPTNPLGIDPTKANAALGLVLAAVAVWLLEPGVQGGRARAVLALGLALGSLGAATLAQDLGAFDLGIDQALVADRTGDPHPGRMAPSTALVLVLLGAGLAASAWSATRRAAPLLGLSTALVALLALVGYVLDVPAWYHVPPYPAMAPGTALGFACLALGLLARHPEWGLVGLLRASTPGGAMARRLLLATAVLPLLLGWLTLRGLREGWYDAGFAVALNAVATAVVFSVLLWGSAARVQRADVELERTAAELKAESRFRTLLESAPDAIVIADRAGRIALVNSQAERTFGYPRGDLLGQPVDLLLAERLRGRNLVGRLGGMDPSAPPLDPDLRLVGRRRDGTEFPAEMSLSPLETEEGTLLSTVIRDVTERQRAEEERLAAVERLQELERLKELDRFKTQFINMAAHELGTPITPLRLQLHLLRTARGQGLSPEQQRAVVILDRNVERLGQLVQDVLEVARLQAGRLGVKKRPLDLNRVVFEAVESFQEPARHQGVDLALRTAPGLLLEGDPKRLTQVLFNLLSNAVKFTPAGGRIEVATRRERGDLVVEVRDTGPGIAAADIPRLFQPFSQVHDPMQKTHSGTGLGLYISKGIVELHGGRIWCESPGPGQGAAFVFALPVAGQAALLPPAGAEPPAPAPAPSQDTIARRAKELV